MYQPLQDAGVVSQWEFTDVGVTSEAFTWCVFSNTLCSIAHYLQAIANRYTSLDPFTSMLLMAKSGGQHPSAYNYFCGRLLCTARDVCDGWSIIMI